MSAKKSVRVYDLEGNWLQDYASYAEASTELNVIVDGKDLKASIYQFRTINSQTPYSISPYQKSRPDKKSIAKYYKGRLIAVYDSVNDCAEKSSIHATIISGIASGKRGDQDNFTFKFIE